MGIHRDDFSEEMDRLEGSVIRKLPQPAIPIDVVATAQILKAIANEVIYGHRNARIGFAQALGFSWICLSGARTNLPCRLNDLFAIGASSIILPSSSNSPSDLIEPSGRLIIPTLCGLTEMPVSDCLCEYLLGISKLQTNSHKLVFNSPMRSVRRRFDAAVQRVRENLPPGDITLRTLLHHPHPFIGSRYIVKH